MKNRGTHRWRQLIAIAAATLLHAGLTLAFFLLYIETAVRTPRGADAPRLTELSQQAKAFFLWPILLPLLQNRADLVVGWRGFVFLFVNSLIWVAAIFWVVKAVSNWRKRRG
jgi:hypothetical protein